MNGLVEMRGIRVNIIGLAAAVVAVVAIFSPWMNYRGVTVLLASGEAAPIEIAFFYPIGGDFEELRLASSIFLAGAMLAFITPVGGFIELTGIGWFAALMTGMTGVVHGVALWIDVTILVGVLSAMMSLGAMTANWGYGYDSESIDDYCRLLVMSRARTIERPRRRIVRTLKEKT